MLRLLKICSFTLVMLLAMTYIPNKTIAQNIATSTPVQASIPSPLPIIATEVTPTLVVETERSPTPAGPVMLEALTEANVRSQPDPDSERLGTIRAGDQYVVLGRYFRWIRFQYNQTAGGVGWVFDELVNIIGDENSITDLSEVESPSQDVNVTQTVAILDQTPGGVQTATAGVNVLPLPVATQDGSAVSSSSQLPVAPQVLPTYTFPSNLPALIPTNVSYGISELDVNATSTPVTTDFVFPSTIPPILPVLVLGALGILGLVIASSRSK
ncbi:MAG: SH3 domain-containing protein [Anaerolineae bacterium]